MKQIEVQILGQGYLLGCPEGGESRLLEAVERVDTAMCRIRDAGKIRARDRIAVLAALNLAYQIAERGTAAPRALDIGDVDLDDLMKRVDRALADDGQLL